MTFRRSWKDVQGTNIYQKISDGMKAAGYDRSAIQCREKSKKLKGEYKKVKDKNHPTGTGRTNWKYYELINNILGNKPATHPPIVIDSFTEETSDESKDANKESLSSSMLSEGDPSNVDADDSSSDVTIKEVKKEKMKRKRFTPDEKLEKDLDKVISKVLTTQNQDKYIEIEEKRFKLEEKMLDMEEQYRKEAAEREQQFRREEREFQLKVFGMLTGHGSPYSPYFNTNNSWLNPSNSEKLMNTLSSHY